MKDWRGIARSAGMEIPPADLERIAASLDALESATAPLFAKLTPEIEPAIAFSAEEAEP